MKPINESRLNNTFKYIKDYCASYGECPTYRQIKDECGYSTLSLVHSDIDRLKERGLLIDEGHKRLHLVSQKEEREIRYDFPFIIVTDALSNVDRMGEEEKILLLAQDSYLQGEYEKAAELSNDLLLSSKDQSVLFGAKLTLCWAAMYSGDVDAWKNFFRALIAYRSKTVSEKKEKELIAHFLTGALGSGENCPSWLSEGRFYELRKEARPLANLLFVANVFKEDPSTSPFLLEPLCSEAAITQNDLCQVYMDLYLASAYHYANEDKYLKEHLDGAIKTCLKHGWITPLIEMNKSLGGAIYLALEERDESLVDKAKKLEAKLYDGFAKIYDVLVEKNPTRNLSFREVEVINFVRLNYETKQIADKLFLSPETVKHYLGSIYSKLGVKNRKELKELIKRNVR